VIFPNPFNNRVMIDYPGNIDQVYIYNCIGQVSLTYQNLLAYNSLSDNSILQLNLDTLEPGIYFLGLRFQNNLVGMEKVIKY